MHTVSRDAPLLVTKLLVPPVPEWLLARPRLLDRLGEAVQGPVTLVTAPAGAGKTLLLASWVAAGRLPGPVVWLSLDADDNDPSRLWADVLAGLRASGGVPPDGLLATLAPPGPGTTDAFLALLVNGLGELPGPVVVVLDDLHELTDPQTMFGVEYLVRHAPAQLRLVLATRTDPALPLARLRVAGSVTEVRAADLVFTQTEAVELLAGHGVVLSDADLAALWARTEGWAAGLRLAAQSLQHHRDPGGFVAAFSGDHRAVADYLLEEVLARRPAEVQDFLLRTSVADRLTGGLADTLTGGQDGARRLVELERTNAFVVPLDAQRTTYRYHKLFAELLRAQLRAKDPDQVPELHRKAARWLAVNGETVDAIRHAVEAEDWGFARGLLVERWPALTGVSALLIRDLLARLPPDLIRRDAELAYIVAGSRITLGDLEGADAFLQLAEANAGSVPQARRAQFAAGVAMIRTYQTRLLGDPASLRARASEQLELAPALKATSQWTLSGSSVRLNGLLHLGTAELWSGDVEAAIDHLEQGLAQAESPTAAAGDAYLQLNCLSQIALAEAARGRLRAAAERGQAAVAFAERRGWSQAMQAFGAHLALAWARYHQGRLAAAAHHLEWASQAAREPTAVVAAALVRSRLLTSQGRPGDGLAALRAAIARTSGGHRWQLLRVPADPLLSEARLLIASGDTQAARALLAQRGGGEPPAPDAAVVSALLQLAEGDPAGAATTLAACLHGPASPAHPLLLLEAWLLDAVVRAELRDQDQAARSLRRALAAADREGYRQVFIDHGAPMRALLARELESGGDYLAVVTELLQLADRQANGAWSRQAMLVRPLSGRELTVLRFLPSPFSTAEIASQLYVSTNTVKTHLRHIYRKLDSSGRREAVNRARQLGLL